MINYKNNGTSVALVRKTKSGDNGISRIYWRVTYKQKQKYLFTGYSFSETDWKDFTDRSLKKHKGTKETLQGYFDETLKPIIDKLSKANNFSFDALFNELGKSDIKTVNDAFNSKIDRLITSNRIGNSTIYKTVKKSLEGYKGTDILFNSISVEFLSNYETYLQGNGVRTATISLYMRTLRAIINNEGKPYLKNESYPFGRGKYIIKTSKGGEKIALTLRQIHGIENTDCGDQLTEFCRDLWLFSFYGSGINFTDLFRLKYTDIVMGELNFVRYKTRNTKTDETFINIPVLEPMKRIIGKHGNKSKGGYIFPLLNDCTNEDERRKNIFNITHESNKRIKAICRELKNEDGTMMIPNFDLVNNYTARHSYATILNKLRVPESYISQQLGHSKSTVTQGYFGEFDRDSRFEYNSLLLNLESDSKIKYINVI